MDKKEREELRTFARALNSDRGGEMTEMKPDEVIPKVVAYPIITFLCRNSMGEGFDCLDLINGNVCKRDGEECDCAKVRISKIEGRKKI